MWLRDPSRLRLPTAAEALPGRAAYAFPIPGRHAVNGAPMQPPWPDGAAVATFGLGCFWGAERLFWRTPGVLSTQVGYAGGHTPHPTYEETCSGRTGHTEVVRVVYDPAQLSFDRLLAVFWEGHDPTQGNRQGNDVGTQYRSAIYVDDAERLAAARASAETYGARLRAAGFGPVTTEIRDGQAFWYAEPYHQQYLHKNPGGYCGLGGTGVSCPIGVGVGAG